MQQFPRLTLLTYGGEIRGVRINGGPEIDAAGIRFEASAEDGVPYRVALDLWVESIETEPLGVARPAAEQEQEAPALPPVFGKQNPSAGE